jgi:cellulose biosynthesis protein BcsQ
MEDNLQAKDIAALFGRAGLGRNATYREFPKERPNDATGGQPPISAIHAVAAAESGAIFGKTAVTEFEAERLTPALDRWQSGTWPQGKTEQPAFSRTTNAFFSLAGGVGKTMLATSLCRVMNGRRRRVVLANCANSFGLQHLLGPDAHTIGSFTFVNLHENTSALPLILIDATETGGSGELGSALKLIQDASEHAHTIILDLPVGLSAVTRETLSIADHIFIPILPDMHSAVTLRSMDTLVELADRPEVHYILNRYDSSRALHREMRDRLQNILGDALLPIYIREDPQIQDAMHSGVTIVDYAPQSEVVADLQALGKWVEQLLPRSFYLKGKTA